MLALEGLLLLGAALGMLEWWGFSNWLVTTAPLARSFAFNLPISLVGSFVILWFCPVQPERKWRGLTLSTVNEELKPEA